MHRVARDDGVGDAGESAVAKMHVGAADLAEFDLQQGQVGGEVGERDFTQLEGAVVAGRIRAGHDRGDAGWSVR